MRNNYGKVGLFLKSLNQAEYRYMELSMQMRSSIQKLILEHSLDKNYILDRFQIPSRKYKDFISGNYNYSVRDMAALNAAFMELGMEKLKEDVPIQVKKEK